MYRFLSILIFCLITSICFGEFLGEYDTTESVYIWADFTNVNGGSATNATTTRYNIFDRNDASAPTSSGTLVAVDINILPGFYRGEDNMAGLATGPCVVRNQAQVTNITDGTKEKIGNTDFFMLLDSGRSPNKTANEVFDINATIPTIRADHPKIISEIRKWR